MYTDFQQKIPSDTSCGTSQKFHCCKVITMGRLCSSTVRVRSYFLLKIGVLRAKGITKSFPNLEECDPNPEPHTTEYIKVVIVVLY